MKLGAHCVLYGPEIASDTDAVISRLALAGAEGCELGERFFGINDRDKLVSVLDKHGMQLAGMHANGMSLLDLLDDPDKTRQALRKVAEFLAPLPNKNIVATGMAGRVGDPEALKRLQGRTLAQGAVEPELHSAENARTIARNLNAIAREIKADFGVQVNYHNHSWEFADQGMLWFALADEAPDVQFALDTGWAGVSGFDPVELLERYPGRFGYVHLRDYNPCDDPGRLTFGQVHAGFVNLGSGAMNYPRLMKALHRELGGDGWAIVEYELGNFDQNSYLRAISYLKGIRDMLG